MTKYQRVEETIMKDSLEGFKYSVNKISNFIMIPIIALLVYGIFNSSLVFSIVIGLYIADFVLYKILKYRPNSIIDIITVTNLNTDNLLSIDIVIEKSTDIESSMLIGRSLDGDDRAIIYIGEIDTIFRLNILADLKLVYHLLVYSNIISMVCDSRFGYKETSNNIKLIKSASIVAALAYIPRVY